VANAESPRTEAPISEADVAKVARLARLDIDDAHVHQFTEQLVKVLAHFRDIDALDLSSVAPMTQPYPLVNVMRDDVELPTLDTDEVLAAAPEAEERRFRVPPIIGLDG
jgi:aspartyl-tRNA(Asn)/glutamyl-tRNA(Gln) amidotransferase subunit C